MIKLSKITAILGDSVTCEQRNSLTIWQKGNSIVTYDFLDNVWTVNIDGYTGKGSTIEQAEITIKSESSKIKA